MTYIWIQVLLFTLGLLALYLGSEGMVRGAVGLSMALHVRPLIIGLTVVAFCTSAPEFFVSLFAALRGTEDICLGNIIGSNIANIGLVLGLSSLASPLEMEGDVLRKEIPILLVTSLALCVVSFDGLIGRLDGLILFSGIIVFIFYNYLKSREGLARFEGSPQGNNHHISKQISLIILGLGGLVFGSHLMVTSGVRIARYYGISELIIGLTIIAVGTSLPELATSVVASIKKQHSITVGNVVGSNVFNILAVLGIVSLIRPLTVNTGVIMVQYVIMIAFTLSLIPLAKSGAIGRLKGLLLLSAYGIFILSCCLRPFHPVSLPF